MANKTNNELSLVQRETLLSTLKNRFEKNMNRHKGLEWPDVQSRIEGTAKGTSIGTAAEKLWSLNEMENTGGEPDVVAYDNATGAFIFFDCSVESPKGRRSVCFDEEALEARATFKPNNNAVGLANEMGIELLTEDQYRVLQQLGHFDTKTSSWIQTPADVRKLGGALFADYRYGKVFVYHNGAQSYYAARGFRGALRM